MDRRRLLELTAAMLGGGGSPAQGNSPESQQFFDRLLTPLSGAEETTYADFIDGLVADGVWARLDGMYYAGPDDAFACTNMVSASYPMRRRTVAGAPIAFVPNQYWTAGSGISFLTNDYNMQTTPGQYKQNDAVVGAWHIPDVAFLINIVRMCNAAGTQSPENEIDPATNTNDFRWTINGTGTLKTKNPLPSPRSGSFIMQRTGAALSEIFVNGTSFDTSTIASAAQIDRFLIWCARSTDKLRCEFFGRALTSGQALALHNRLATLVSAVAGTTP